MYGHVAEVCIQRGLAVTRAIVQEQEDIPALSGHSAVENA